MRQKVEGVLQELIEKVEKEIGSKVFTIRVREDKEESLELKAIIVFENKEILESIISIEMEGTKIIGLRTRGNWL